MRDSREFRKMGSTTKTYHYTILPIATADEDQVMQFLKRTFFAYNPVNVAAGVTQNCPDLEAYVRKYITSPFSLRAVDEQGNIVAASVSGIYTNEESQFTELANEVENCADPNFQKILRILAHQAKNARLWERYPRGCQILEMKAAATDPEWGGRGLMTALVHHTERLARAHDVKYMRMDSSNAYSARVADKLGYECVSRALYRDIRHNGVVLADPAEPHVEDRVNVKTIK